MRNEIKKLEESRKVLEDKLKEMGNKLEQKL